MTLTQAQVNEFGFKLPGHVVICARTLYGKGIWFERVLCPYLRQQADKVVALVPPGSRGQETYKRLKKKWVDEEGNCWFHMVEGDTLDEMEGNAQVLIDRGKTFSPPFKTILLFDDLQEMTRNRCRKWIQNKWVSGRHEGISCIECRQDAFGNATARNNAQYLVLGKTTMASQMAALFKQLTSNKTDQQMLEKAYKIITNRVVDKAKQTPGFLVLDMTQPSSDDRQARDTELNCVIPQIKF